MHASECLYPLTGGLMLGSCVYHLLYLNGNVLGISGIYGTAVSRAISIVGLNLSRISTSAKKSAPNESQQDGATAEDALLGDSSTPTSPPKEIETEPEDGDWQMAFTMGLLAAGALLRTIRPYLERSLGIPIFDPVLGNESSRVFQLSLFVVGLLVGLGTKMANGCTAGHMLCGMSRLSVRSTIATITFFATAVAVHLLHPGQQPPRIVPQQFKALTVLLLQIPFLFYRFIIPALAPKKWYQNISSFAVAVHFALGLALAGMLQPSKIQNFLALPMSPNFDPSLAFVAIGGLVPNVLAWTTQLRYASKPVFGAKFSLPDTDGIDWKLIVGSIIFGAGWGWSGICPGPGIVLEGAFVERWRSIGTWILGMSVGRLITPS